MENMCDRWFGKRVRCVGGGGGDGEDGTFKGSRL